MKINNHLGYFGLDVFLDFYIGVTLVFPGLDLFYFYLLDYLNIWKREDIAYLKQHCLNTMEFELGPELDHSQGCRWTGSSFYHLWGTAKIPWLITFTASFQYGLWYPTCICKFQNTLLQGKKPFQMWIPGVIVLDPVL